MDESDPDPGLLDLLDDFSTEMDLAAESMERIGDSMVEGTEKMEGHADRMDAATKAAGGRGVRPSRLMGMASLIAADMDAHSDKLELEGPEFASRMRSSLAHFVKAVPLLPDFGEDARQEFLQTVEPSSRSALESIMDLRKSLTEALPSIDSLPRLSTKLNASKKRLTKALKGLIAAVDETIDLLSSVQKTMSDGLKGKPLRLGDKVLEQYRDDEREEEDNDEDNDKE